MKPETILMIQRDFALLAEQVATLQMHVYALRNRIMQVIADTNDEKSATTKDSLHDGK